MARTFEGEMEQIDANRWRIPKASQPSMRVDGIIYASEALIAGVLSGGGAAQVANVATLPGIVGASMAMPDIHWGYGFPIGGVAATDVAAGGVVSPGGVGYDINCGVRLLSTDLRDTDVRPHIKGLVDQLFRDIPAGVGVGGPFRFAAGEMRKLLTDGVRYLLGRGLAEEVDVAARYAPSDLLLSGWELGADRHLGGRAAVVRFALGKGRIVLIGFRSQFRVQPRATFKLLFNSLLASTMKDPS